MERIMSFERINNIYNNTEYLQSLRVLIVGVGGIGSAIAPELIKMGITNLQLWDHDTLENVNIRVQNYRLRQVKQAKVKAMQDNIQWYTDVLLPDEDCKEEKWWGNDLSFNPDIILLAVDSMKARETIWYNLKSNPENKNRILIDTRMSAFTYQICITRIDPETKIAQEYERIRLYKDEDAIQESCGAANSPQLPKYIAGTLGTIFYDLANKNKVSHYWYTDERQYLFTKSTEWV
jgi:molybdopterin/thiamine biosynthesis adenylyltransferase